MSSPERILKYARGLWLITQANDELLQKRINTYVLNYKQIKMSFASLKKKKGGQHYNTNKVI